MMGNRSPDNTYETPLQTLPFMMDMWARDSINTAVPGLVEKYEAKTRRAQVRPALRAMIDDGSTIPLGVIMDVPVIHPAGGGYVFHVPLQPGDGVMLLFSQRGIDQYKDSYKLSNPSMRFFSMQDAVAIPGFGAKEMTPVAGMSMQREDAEAFISIDGDKITLKTGDTMIEMTPSNLKAVATRIDWNP